MSLTCRFETVCEENAFRSKITMDWLKSQRWNGSGGRREGPALGKWWKLSISGYFELRLLAYMHVL